MLPKHIRITALQCNFQTREETLGMPERWSDIGFNVEQLLHTHADLYSAVYDPARHRQLLTDYLEKSQAQGLRTIIYMNVHILGPSLKEHYDDWCTRDANGRPILLYGTYPGCCLYSGWKHYFFDCLESMREFDIEGFFFDGPAMTECHCPNCEAVFQERYGKAMSQGSKQELKEFVLQKTAAFKKELYNKVKSINPAWISYYNEGLLSASMPADLLCQSLANNDIIGTEGGFFFYDEPRKIPYWKCSVWAKIAESVADGKPTVIFFAGDHKAWGWFMHTDSELKLCYASALANGASVWMGLHHRPDSLERASGKAIREMVQFDKQYDALYQNTHSLAEVAIFYSYNSACKYSKTFEGSDFYNTDCAPNEMPGDYYSTFQGAVAVLEHLNTPFDIVTELHPEKMLKYKTVLVPGMAMLDDASLKCMLEFVQNGGLMIADGAFGFCNADGTPRVETALLRQLTGAVPDNTRTDMSVFNYMSIADKSFPNDNAFGYIPAPKWCYKLQLLNGAEPAVLIPEPMAGCYASRPGTSDIPIAVSKKQGNGECIFFAGGLFEFYGRYQIHAIRNWIKFVLDKRRYDFSLINAKPGISMTVRATIDDQALVHLTNSIGVTRPLDGVVPLDGMKLLAPVQFRIAIDLKTNGELNQDSDGSFILPQQTEYAVFLLKK